MEIKKYQHRPNRIEAVKVTADNMDDLATWVGGWVTVSGSGKVIVWRQTRGYGANSSGARAGQWLCRTEEDQDNFFTMTDREWPGMRSLGNQVLSHRTTLGLCVLW